MTEQKEWIDIGDNHSYRFAKFSGDPHAGVYVKHLTPDGKNCEGWCPVTGGAWSKEFEGMPNHQSWEMHSSEPLTLTPSIACRACGDHGFITNGKWVKA